MGWDSSPEWRGSKDVQRAVVSDLARSGARVLDSASTSGGRHFWLAIEQGGKKYIALALIAKVGARGDTQWGFKFMDEGMGPSDDDVPMRMFDLFPAPTETAAKWREKARRGATLTLAPGTPVWFNGRKYTIAGMATQKGQHLGVDERGKTYRLKTSWLSTTPPEG